MANDTMWLECTSQTESCGFLGTHTDNRLGLAVTPQGGRVLRTPKYDETANTIRRETRIVVEPTGMATLRSSDVYSGILQENYADLESQSDEERKKLLYEWLDINNFEIKQLALKRNRGKIPSVERQIELLLPGFAAANGQRLFVPMSPLFNKLEVPNAQEKRTASVQAHSRGMAEEDNLTLELPLGYLVEAGLEAVKLESKFGSYELSATVEGQKIQLHRKLVLNSSIHPKETYGELVAFLKAVAKADKSKLVLKQTQRP
jgi:hypothetical protein